MQRGHCLEDTGRLLEAQVAYALAYRLAPTSPEGLGYLVNALNIEAREKMQRDADPLPGAGGLGVTV